MRIQVIGNCQAEAYSEAINLLGIGVKSEYVRIESVDGGYAPSFDTYDFVLSQAHSRLKALNESITDDRFIIAPTLTFTGYHPDLIFLTPTPSSPAPRAQSNIIVNAFLSGLSQKDCAQLFSAAFIAKLDYESRFEIARQHFAGHLTSLGLDGDFLFEKWSMNGPFMLLPEHPETEVIQDIVEHLCTLIGVKTRPCDLNAFNVNRMKLGTIFPTYRGYTNTLASKDHHYRFDGAIYGVEEFIARSYEALREEFGDANDAEKVARLPGGRRASFEKALQAHQADADAPRPNNPYKGRPDAAFWRKSVAAVAVDQVAPVYAPNYGPSPLIGADTRVATAGSCFAQHIAKTLSAQGLNYHVAETPPPSMPEAEAQTKGYGLFSARYGNIYTARQLLQLGRRAYGTFEPEETYWVSKSGKLIDPFRPNLGEEFDNLGALEDSRASHFECVRSMFRDLNLFVFTLGLTESWTNAHDGAVYPVAPGVVSQHADYANYEFRNFSKDETVRDMVDFLALLRAVNPDAQVLLTVSPVPLIATYEDEHALSATTYSKSVLRTAAQELSCAFSFVSYFPSYEIVTGSYNRGAYFEDDLRSVRQEGVDHVMRVLTQTLVAGAGEPQTVSAAAPDEPVNKDILREIDEINSIVCDEELIESNM